MMGDAISHAQTNKDKCELHENDNKTSHYEYIIMIHCLHPTISMYINISSSIIINSINHINGI